MGKNQSASNLVNIIQYNNGNISFVSGSTTLMQISSSGAITTTGVISGSNALSSSYAVSASLASSAVTASFVQNAQTASFVALAQSASNAVTAQTASYADALTVAGTLTAQTLVVQTITSSVDFVTGSTRFGSVIGNTHVFTGSIQITSGSINNAVYGIGGNYKEWVVGDYTSGTNYNTLELRAYTEPRIYFNTNGGGNLSFYNSYGNVGLSLQSGSYTNDILYYDHYYGGKSVSIGAGGSTRLFISGSGLVGIGTTSPNNPLHVETTALDAGIQLYTNEASNGGSAPLFLSHKTSGGAIKTVNIEGTGTGTFNIRTGATALNSYGDIRLAIEADGAMSYNTTTVAQRTFMFKAQSGRPIAMEFLEPSGVHAVYVRPNASGRHLITSDYITGGTFLPLSLSGRENDADLVLQTNGNISIGNASDIGTKLQVNGANYVEMATFACTSAAASTIVSDNAGYVQFSSGNARHCSNTGLFVPTTNGIQITKAGIVHVSFSQDITTTGTTGYVAGHIRKNGNTFSENLITNTNGQWDGLTGVGTIDVAANDVIGFYINASDITSFDANTWSQYSLIWTSR